MPENQLTPEVKYFDLRMSPSGKQTVSIKLTNHTSKKMTIKVVYSEAKTTSQGVIEYSKNNDLKSNSPSEYLFPNLVSGPDSLIIEPNEIKIVDFILKMPKKKFDGVVVGGIEFIQELENVDTKKSSLRAQHSHLIGFRLSESDKKLPIDLMLDQTIVGTNNYKNAILISLVNLNANLVENLSIHAKISKKNEQSVLFNTEMKSIRIAPYSVLETPIYIDNTLLDLGDYEIKLIVENTETYHKEWTQEFKVVKKDVELLKDNDELWKAPGKKWLLYKIGFGIVVLLIISMTVAITWLNRKANVKKIKKAKGKKNDNKKTL